MSAGPASAARGRRCCSPSTSATPTSRSGCSSGRKGSPGRCGRTGGSRPAAGAPPTSTSRSWASCSAAPGSSSTPSRRSPSRRWCRPSSRRSSSSAARHLKIEPLVVGPGIKTGVPILYENPREVGADRIVNAVAAYERWPQGAIVVDFGTATTFDVITARGEYVGGVIAPGLIRLGRRALPGDRQAAAGGDRPPRHGDRPQHRGQHAVGAGVRLRRPGRRHRRAHPGRDRLRAARGRDRRPGAPHRRARRAPSTSATTC